MRRDKIIDVKMSYFGIKPFYGCNINTVFIGRKPSSPPTKTTVGNNVMLAITHQSHVFPSIFRISFYDGKVL